jgi:hypothetical protein
MHILGEYVAKKYRTRMRAHLSKFNTAAPGVGNTVAQQLRKQGYSLDMALLILLGTRERGAALGGLGPYPGDWVPWNGTESMSAAVQREAMRRHDELAMQQNLNPWNCGLQNTLGASPWVSASAAAYPPPSSAEEAARQDMLNAAHQHLQAIGLGGLYGRRGSRWTDQ